MSDVKYTKQEPETIQSMFGSIAEDYDRGNAILSFSCHRLWNRSLVNEITKHTSPGDWLDLCAGTGDIAIAYLKKNPTSGQIYLLDFCEEMLHCAKHKIEELNVPQPVTYIHGDAQQIPLADEAVSHVSVAYGIRNVKEPFRCIQEAYRVLKKGGAFGILELTRPTHPVLRLGHQAYLTTFLPLIGKWVTRNKDAYRYLCQSIQDFVAPQEMASLMREAGFSETKVVPLMGGIASIICGKK